MADYVLQPDEYVVLKAQEVKLDGKSSFSMSNGSELMLTNKSIVLPIKGIFGKTKRCEVYPSSTSCSSVPRHPKKPSAAVASAPPLA